MLKKVLILLTIALLFIGIGVVAGRGLKNYFTQTIAAAPSGGETVSMLEGNLLAVASSYTKGITDRYFTKDDCFAPKGVVISWESPEGVISYTVTIGTREDLSDAQSYETAEKSIALRTLRSATHYYYQITAVYADKTDKSRIFDFVTAELPRTVFIEGISNTRDIGGYLTEDGNYRVRQGMVYRGAALDDLSEAAKETVLDTLGIHTDLDLRGMSDQSPLGSSVNFISVSAPYYAQRGSTEGIQNATYKEALVTEIKSFTDPDNYPIYVHCQIGRDRTGTLAFLINALLGVSEEDLYLDYELSFMSEAGCRDFKDTQVPSTLVVNQFSSLYNFIDNYEESGTLSEKTERFMLDLGITAEEIASIRSILLVDSGL